MQLKDETGNAFGMLTVLRRVPGPRDKGAYWECQCECGKLTTARGDNLRGGRTWHCGCQMPGHLLANLVKGTAAFVAACARRAAEKRREAETKRAAGPVQSSLSSDERDAVEVAIASGRIMRIENGQWPDEGRLYRKKKWAHGGGFGRSA